MTRGGHVERSGPTGVETGRVMIVVGGDQDGSSDGGAADVSAESSAEMMKIGLGVVGGRG